MCRLDLCDAYAGDSSTIVGAEPSSLTMDVSNTTQRIKQLDSDIESLDIAVDADRKKMLAKVAAGGVLDAQEQARVKWSPDWTNFKFDWSAFKAAGVYLGNEDQISVFEQRYRQLYATYTKMPGAVIPPTPPSPLPPPASASGVPWDKVLWVGGALAVAIAASSAAKFVRG